MEFKVTEIEGNKELHLTVSVKEHPFFMSEFGPGFGSVVKSNTGCFFTVIEITEASVTLSVSLSTYSYNAPEMLKSKVLNMFNIKSFVSDITSFSTPTDSEVAAWEKRERYC